MTKSILYRPNRYRKTTVKKSLSDAQDLEIHKTESCDNGLCLSPSDWYQRAQIAFQRSVLQMPVDLVKQQRQSEWELLEQFWLDNTKPPPNSRKLFSVGHNVTGKSIYISGPPGTGKSAAISAFIESKKPFPGHILLIHVNCMTLKEPRKLQKHLIDQWCEPNKKTRNRKRSDPFEQEDVFQSDSNQSKQLQVQKWESLKSLFFKSNNTYVLVLDEMDQLIQHGSNVPLFASTSTTTHSTINSDQQPSFLYHLFELSQLPNSRFALIGIANAMDLMHHWIPKFNAHQLHPPKQCHFAPFTIEQTMLMLKHRIQVSISTANCSHLSCNEQHRGFHPTALELCSRKVASMGDFRKALDLCRLTVERAEKDYFDNLLSKNEDQIVFSYHVKENQMNDNINTDTKRLDTNYLVNLQHVKQAISLIFGSPLMQTMIDLNLHHQLVLISIYLISKHEKQEAVFPLVLQKYTQLCQLKHIQLIPLTRSEFHDSLTLLEGKNLILMKRGSSIVSSSIVSMKRKKSGSFGGGESMMIKHMETRMSLKCHEEDLIKGLAHVPMLISLIEKEEINKIM